MVNPEEKEKEGTNRMMKDDDGGRERGRVGKEDERLIDGTVVCPFPGFSVPGTNQSLAFETVEPHVQPRHTNCCQTACGRQPPSPADINRLCISCILSIHERIDIQKTHPAQSYISHALLTKIVKLGDDPSRRNSSFPVVKKPRQHFHSYSKNQPRDGILPRAT